jgi:alpha-galactosidase
MRRQAHASVGIAVVTLAAATWGSTQGQAAQTTSTISMTPAPAAPRLQGPFTFAARPTTPFLFAIPTTGQGPLTFAATGLPTGLALASDTGIISGTTPAAGSYPVTVTVTSSAGGVSATFTFVSGDTISLTPPVGWNSYDSYGASIKEDEVLAQAQAIRTSLQPYGWNTVVIDYRWYDPQDHIDANGRYLPSTDKYPSATGSNGFKPLADKVHALGLGFGIHIMRGIPRTSYASNTPIANSSYKAQDAGNANDPCPWDTHMWGVRGDTAAGQAWYDALFAQYASWGVDFIKIDDMVNNNTTTYHQAEVDAIRASINKSGRSIVLSLSPGPMLTMWATDLGANANMWRIVNDFWDYNGLSTLTDVFTAAGNWQAVTALSAGHWPDADMLPLGYLGPRDEWHASGQTTFSRNDQVTIMSLWGIMPSPLIFGGNPQSLASDPWTLALLSNEELMAVNQDPTGTHARRVVQQGTTEVWARDLSRGRKAVALFNRGTQDATVSVTFSTLGVAGTPSVRDVWHRADVTGMTTGLSVNVPYGGALVYVLSPASTGAGGATGAGGGAAGGGGVAGQGGRGAGAAGSGGGAGAGGRGAGGAAATGGALGTAGAGGTSGSAGAGAAGTTGSAGASAPGTGGATGNSTGATGGSTATGGVRGTGGAVTGGASGAGDTTGMASSGCGCDLAPGNGTFTSFLLLLFVLRARSRRGPRATKPITLS